MYAGPSQQANTSIRASPLHDEETDSATTFPTEQTAT